IPEINKDPGKWADKQVSLQGEVEEVLAPGMFVLDGDGLVNDNILVIDERLLRQQAGQEKQADQQQAGQSQPSFEEDDEITLDGKVRKMSVSEIKRDYSVTLTPEIERELRGNNAVVVTSFDKIRKGVD